MRIISIINLKGGVGKTTTAINMAMILAHIHKKRVLLVDNDIQANTTMYFEMLDYDRDSVGTIYQDSNVDVRDIIRPTAVSGCTSPNYILDLIPSNMNMDSAVTDLVKDEGQDQIHRLRNALNQVSDNYDFCIIDNPPGVGMNVINALVCTHDVIIPIKVDKAAMDGMEELIALVGEMAEFNDRISMVNGLITMFYKSTEMIAGEMVLRRSPYNIFDTHIRYSRKVDSGSFEVNGRGLLSYSVRSAACIDYKRFAAEYLGLLPLDVSGGGDDNA